MLESGIYTDFHSLQTLKSQAADFDKSSLKATAKQFESIFVQTMLKSMRQANDVFKEDSMIQSDAMDFYLDMFDKQVSMSLSDGGIGLAPIIEKHLSKDLRFKTQDIASKDKMAHLNIVPNESKVKPFVEKATESIKASCDNPKDFVKSLYPMLKSVANILPADPKIILAQAALETGWGKHVLFDAKGQSSHNLFNIKASSGWSSSTVSKASLEFESGAFKPVQSDFRGYENFEQSIKDYADFIKQNPRYQEAMQATDARGYIKALQTAGYATHPDYAEKILSIYQNDWLSGLD